MFSSATKKKKNKSLSLKTFQFPAAKSQSVVPKSLQFPCEKTDNKLFLANERRTRGIRRHFHSPSYRR